MEDLLLEPDALLLDEVQQGPDRRRDLFVRLHREIAPLRVLERALEFPEPTLRPLTCAPETVESLSGFGDGGWHRGLPQFLMIASSRSSSCRRPGRRTTPSLRRWHAEVRVSISGWDSLEPLLLAG